jgi:serine/threonine-protein kinase
LYTRQLVTLVGTTVGSYRVERLLGEGGMGAVYELVHPGIGKRLALKLLHAEYAARPQIVQRFFDEARAVNLIRHPNIVDVLDFAHLPDGRAYITMEYLEGQSLHAFLHGRGALSPAEVREILLPICSALGAAHAAGIVHRDLKPENIHLVPRPDNPRYVKLLDFGIAKLSADLHQEPGVATRSGVVMGTPSYMSPEQAMGRTREVDHRTDVYALGVILFEMLTGAVPFSADSFGDLMLMHLQKPPPPLAQLRPDLPPAWGHIVDTALAKRREDRFQSMEEFSRAVQSASPTTASSRAPHTLTPPPARTVAPEPPARSRAPLFAAAGLLAAAAAVTILLLTRSSGSTPSPDAAVTTAAPTPPGPSTPHPTPATPTPSPPTPIDAGPPPDVRPRSTPGPSTPTGDGTLVVIVKPWADVTIDGTPAGITPVTRTLRAGRHKVRLRNSELGKDTTTTVTIRPKKTERLTRDWQK